MSPKLPLPIFLTRRYFPPTTNSLHPTIPEDMVASALSHTHAREGWSRTSQSQGGLDNTGVCHLGGTQTAEEPFTSPTRWNCWWSPLASQPHHHHHHSLFTRLSPLISLSRGTLGHCWGSSRVGSPKGSVIGGPSSMVSAANQWDMMEKCSSRGCLVGGSA